MRVAFNCTVHCTRRNIFKASFNISICCRNATLLLEQIVWCSYLDSHSLHLQDNISNQYLWCSEQIYSVTIHCLHAIFGCLLKISGGVQCCMRRLCTFPCIPFEDPLPPDSCPAAAGRAITPQRHNTLSCICIHTATVFVFILSKSLEGNKSLKSRIWFAIGISENVLNPGCEGLAQSHKKFQFITLNEKSHRCQCIPNDHKSKGDPGPSKH